MKLVECLKMGHICGLKYVGECLDNVLMHMDIFPYDIAVKEEEELLMEFDKSGFKDEDKTEDVLKFYGIDIKELDDEVGRDLDELNKKLENYSEFDDYDGSENLL